MLGAPVLPVLAVVEVGEVNLIFLPALPLGRGEQGDGRGGDVRQRGGSGELHLVERRIKEEEW